MPRSSDIDSLELDRAPQSRDGVSRGRQTVPALLALSVVTAFGLTVAAVSHPSSAYAADAPVNLRTVASYSVLGGQTVTNTGLSVLSNDVGVSPGTAITGFPPGVTLGVRHAADAAAAQAKADLKTAYDDASGRASTASAGTDLVGRTLVAGVYTATRALQLNGTVTLDGQGDPDAVFIFQVPSTLITGSRSAVAFTRGAQACNVYWQVGTSATIGTGSRFAGTIMALASVSVRTGATVDGRALARNGQVSLQTNTFTRSACVRATASPSPSASDTATASPSASDTATASPSPSATTPTSSGSPTSPTVPPVPGPTETTATPTRAPSSPTTRRPTTTRPTSSTTTTRPAPTRGGEGVEGESASASTTRTSSRGTSSTSVRASDESTPVGRLSDTGSGPYDGPIALGALLLVTVGTAFAIVGWRRRYVPRH